ncbi:hypothetical protein MTO96_003100 [Rhipicephalus appendiculatus]
MVVLQAGRARRQRGDFRYSLARSTGEKHSSGCCARCAARKGRILAARRNSAVLGAPWKGRTLPGCRPDWSFSSMPYHTVCVSLRTPHASQTL